MSKVFVANLFTMQLKTTCCEVPIKHEPECPKCGAGVMPKTYKERREYVAGRKRR